MEYSCQIIWLKISDRTGRRVAAAPIINPLEPSMNTDQNDATQRTSLPDQTL